MNAGKALQAKRRRVMHTCAGAGCEVEFEGIVTARFCSNACRQRAKYARQKKERPR